MATVYIPDELMAKIIATKEDRRVFVKQAIEEKLKKEHGDDTI